MSKIVELVLDRIVKYVNTSCNQFEFKQKLGTDMCIYSFKELVDRYKSVLMYFLDTSKAFDHVKHLAPPLLTYKMYC